MKCVYLVLATMSLSSCNQPLKITTPDVSGTLTGTPPQGKISLAFIPMSYRHVPLQDIEQFPVANFDGKNFTFDLPKINTNVLYQIVAFVDVNSDGKYNFPIDKGLLCNNKFFYYDTGSGSQYNTKPGWNTVVWTADSVVTKQGKAVDYELKWQ